MTFIITVAYLLLIRCHKLSDGAFPGKVWKTNIQVTLFAESLEICRIHALLAYDDMDVEAPPKPNGYKGASSLSAHDRPPA